MGQPPSSPLRKLPFPDPANPEMARGGCGTQLGNREGSCSRSDPNRTLLQVGGEEHLAAPQVSSLSEIGRGSQGKHRQSQTAHSSYTEMIQGEPQTVLFFTQDHGSLGAPDGTRRRSLFKDVGTAVLVSQTRHTDN